jgi:hypothetical protein
MRDSKANKMFTFNYLFFNNFDVAFLFFYNNRYEENIRFMKTPIGIILFCSEVMQLLFIILF